MDNPLLYGPDGKPLVFPQQDKTDRPVEATERPQPAAPGQHPIVPEVPPSPSNLDQPAQANQNPTPAWEIALGVCGAVIAFGLLIVNLFQTRATQRAADAATDAARIARDARDDGDISSDQTLRELRRQSRALLRSAETAKQSAGAAKSAARTAASQLELAERPWLYLQELKIESGLTYNPSGGTTLAVTPVVKNDGGSPAAGVFSNSEMIVGNFSDAVTERQRFCDARVRLRPPSYDETVFTKDKKTLLVDFARISGERLSTLPVPAGSKTAVISPFIINCVAYRSTFNPDSIYYTGTIFEMWRFDPAHPQLQFVFLVGENVPIANIRAGPSLVGAVLMK